MTNAKLFRNLVLSMVLVLFSAFSFIGCGEDESMKYKLNFVVDNQVYKVVDFNDASTVEMPQDPTKTGYKFEGWFWDNGTWQQPFSTEALPDRELTEEMNVYAKFEVVYTIDFNLNGGSVFMGLLPTSYLAEDLPIGLPIPTKTGYRFLGWTGSNGTTPQQSVIIAQGEEGNKEYTANFEVITYSITYDTQGGTLPENAPTSYTVEDLPLVLPTPTLEGSEFNKWEREANVITYRDYGVLPVGTLGDWSVVAHWTHILYIRNDTFELDGENYNLYTLTGVNQDYAATLTSVVIPSRVNIIDSGAFVNCTELKSLTIQSNNTLILDNAVWVFRNCSKLECIVVDENNTVYDSRDNCNAIIKTSTNELIFGCKNTTIPNTVTSIGAYAFGYCVALTSIEIPSSVTSIGGHAFVGCSMTEITIPSSVTSINYSAFDGFDALETINYVGSEQQWNEIGYVYIPDGVVINFLKDAIIYDLNDGISPEATLPAGAPLSYSAEDLPLTLPTPTRTGYTFVGWTGSNGDTPQLSVTIPAGATGAKEYNANWNVINYSIGYNLNGGEFENSAITSYTVAYLPFTLDVPTKSGYNFLGWTGSNGTTPQIEVRITLDTIGNKTYTANYQAIEYTITYNLAEGELSANAPTSYTVEDLPLTLFAPTKTGYNFIGWTGSNGDTPQTEVTIPVGTTGNKTYTANYQAIEYAITYNLNNGELPFGAATTFTIEDNLTLPTPTKTGYNFLGWTGSNGDTPQTEVIIPVGTTGAKEYTANYQVIVYTITYNLDEGEFSVDAPTSYTVEDLPLTLPTPTKPAYDFVGWTGSNGDTPQTEVTIPAETTGNKTYTANWELVLNIENTTVKSVTDYGKTLTSITIPDGVRIIDSSAFDGCSELRSIVIPSGVTAIYYQAFANCVALESIVVDPLNIIYDSRNNCNAIIRTSTNTLIVGCKNTIIPNTVTSIGISAFKGCASLSSIEIPSNVTSIGSSAFDGCTALTSIVIPSGVTSIEGFLFNNCENLESVTIPNTVTSIGNYAFAGCASLSSIEIPSGVTSIRVSAFAGCASLSSIEIPSNVTSIKQGAFDGCTALTSIVIPSGVTSIEGFLFNNCENLESVTIPNTVTSIGSYAFAGCASLSSIEIPSGVTSIGVSAFKGCTALTSIVIPSGVTSIESSLFYDCENLDSVTIPNTVTSIGSSAFKGCASLSSIEIPSNVTSIGGAAFNGCTALTSIVIPSGVTSIENSLFYNCENLESVTIPNTVTSIDNAAFEGCASLSSIEIPSNVTSIGISAFAGCASLSSIEIPSGVTSIGYYMFTYCENLESVTIPSSVTIIDNFAFDKCTSLQTINFTGTEEQWDAIPKGNASIPSGVTIVYNYVAS